MATLTLTIPTAQVNRVLDDLSTLYGYTGFESDNVTPQTKQEFVRKLLIKFIKDGIKKQEGVTASKAAIDGVKSDVDNNLNIT